MSSIQSQSRNLRPRRDQLGAAIDSNQDDSIRSNEHISHLPPEVLMNILGHIKARKLIGLKRVSKQFEGAIEAMEASRKRIAIGRGLMAMAATIKSRRNKYVAVVQKLLTKTNDEGQIVPRYPEAFKLKVKINAILISERAMRQISEVVRFGLPKLTKLVVTIEVNNSGHFYSSLNLGQLTRLRCKYISPEDLKKCTALQNLKRLCLFPNFTMFYDSLEFLLKNHATIIKIKMPRHMPSVEQTSKVIELITKEVRPTLVCLPNMRLVGATFQNFRAVSVAVPNLKNLTLSYQEQFSVGTISLFKGLTGVRLVGVDKTINGLRLSGEEIVQRLLVVPQLKALRIILVERVLEAGEIINAMSDCFPHLKMLRIVTRRAEIIKLENLNCRRLKKLRLRNCDMKEADLLDFNSRHQRLRSVKLNNILVPSAEYANLEAWQSRFRESTRGIKVRVQNLRAESP